MLIIGELSGIQDYLFDVTDRAGGQSRRLRARSFFLQALSEIAALRILRAAGWHSDHILMNAAGRFILRGPSLSTHKRAEVDTDFREVCEWLLRHSGAKVRLTLALGGDDGTPLEQYDDAMRVLRRAKFRGFSQLASAAAGWDPSVLVLESSSPACEICRRRKAIDQETDPDGKEFSVCSGCLFDLKIGQQLPHTRWVTIKPKPAGSQFEIAGLGVSTDADQPRPSPEALCIFDLTDGPDKGPPFQKRRLARHVPSSDHFPLDFDALADASEGAKYLGVLKMDVDSLGSAVRHHLESAAELDVITRFSHRLDTFFATTLDNELSKPRWQKIYTIFSGGDDLLLVGPWNTMFDYAGHVQKMFRTEFTDLGLTISAGLTMVRKKTPIRRAAEQADQLLETAKDKGRDRFAAFGQVWEWNEHKTIAQNANWVTAWVRDNSAERGWLQTLLRMTEAREREPLTTARLVYHVERNYPRSNDNDPNKRALRTWMDQIVRDFDGRQRVETRYLPAILRYALTATRAATTGGDD
jgi:CRISPR-associated protein Csm1